MTSLQYMQQYRDVQVWKVFNASIRMKLVKSDLLVDAHKLVCVLERLSNM
jgi:hypothetical protein